MAPFQSFGPILLLCLSIGVPCAQAQASSRVAQFPEGLTYLEAESLKPEWQAPTLSTLRKIRKLLATQGLEEIDPDPSIKIPSLSIYADSELGKSAFLKLAINVSDPKILGKIIPMDQGYLYHGKIPGTETEFALFITDAHSDQMEELIDSVESSVANKNWITRLISVFQEKEVCAADSSGDCESEDEGPLGYAAMPLLKNLRAAVASFEHETFHEGKKRGWLRCPWGLMTGTWDGTLGSIWDLANTITRIGQSTTHLVKDPKKFWQRTYMGFKNLGNLYKHFNLKKILNTLYPQKKDHHPGEKTQEACKVFAEVAVFFGTSVIPVTAATSIAQKSLLLYHHSSNYQAIVRGLKGTDKASKIGAKLTEGGP